jgi:Ca2+-binding RTX toxin-like protein
MNGGTGDDAQDGGTGNDTIFANIGQDSASGGDGNDVRWALARSDVQPGPYGETDMAGDKLNGGAGDDVLRTRDGEADQIICGDGRDLALLDRADVIGDATAENKNGSCEKVKRMAPRPREFKAEDAQGRKSEKDERIPS